MILLAKSSLAPELPAEGDIQWAPPGRHEICAKNAQSGKPETRIIVIDEDGAEAIAAAVRRFQDGEATGHPTDPYVDFDHMDHEAAGWVKEVYWGGDDPQTGGIRAKVEWTPKGKEAIEGRTYRRFSPGFFTSVPDARGECRMVGVPMNMGGLVNRPAFQTIANLTGKDGEDDAVPGTENQTKTDTMSEDEVKALQAELEALKQENEELKKNLANMQTSAAEEVVAKACQEGRIAPETKETWKGLIMKDPTAKELLAKQPVNPAFVQVFTAKDAKPDGDKLTGAALLAKYGAIEDPDERFRFYREHEKELIQARG